MEKIAQSMQALLIRLIRCYKFFISPYLGQRCRFYPSCSAYSLQALKQYGVCKGVGLSVLRLLKCNPFFLGGYDPVPNKNQGTEIKANDISHNR